jgi:group I intron endonuclease
MKVVGIYKITSPSGKVYIGQSWNIHQRWKWHKNEKDYKGPLQKSFDKHGFANHKFEVVHELPQDVEQAILDTFEVIYIELYDHCKVNLLNVAPGGRGGKGYKHRDEDKKRMSDIAKKRGVSFEEIARMHKANTGKPLSEERKRKISDTLKGHVFTEERKKNIAKALKGRPANSGSFKAGQSIKLTPEQVNEIRTRYIPFVNGYISLGRKYGVNQSTIQDIVKRKTWTHI